jgi:hypothetical protein
MRHQFQDVRYRFANFSPADNRFRLMFVRVTLAKVIEDASLTA